MFSPEMVITMACWPNKDYACMLSALAIALVTSAVIKSMPTGDGGGGFVHSGSMIGLRRQRGRGKGGRVAEMATVTVMRTKTTGIH
jgi:hypothetical protein